VEVLASLVLTKRWRDISQLAVGLRQELASEGEVVGELAL
jgi:hypothetical protein